MPTRSGTDVTSVHEANVSAESDYQSFEELLMSHLSRS